MDINPTDDLEKEYSPAQNSHRAANLDDPDELIRSFTKVHEEETARVKKVYNSRLDVKYGDTKRQSVDIYFKDEESDKPIFVYVHGGYWTSLSKEESGICVAPLVERGYRVVVMDYDLCPDVTLTRIVYQMKKFFKFLLKYATQTNAEQISLLGHSAGAHLLATLFEENVLNLPNINLIKNVFLFSGLYDLRDLRTTNAGNPNNVLSLDKRSAEELSPILFEFPESLKKIKLFIVYAEYDSEVFKQQSVDFFDKLEEDEFVERYYTLMDYDHFTIIEDLRNEKSNVANFILEELGLKSKD